MVGIIPCKDAERIENSGDPYQTVPLGICPLWQVPLLFTS